MFVKIHMDTSSSKHCLNEVYVFVMHNWKATAVFF